MILFRDDWQRYPDAIVDLKTPNTSFIRLAKLYKHMGVKNHAFPLVLHQRDLQGIDPFDQSLDAHTKTLIRLECRYNPWYFFREVARLPPQAGPRPVQLQANRGNIALFWSFFNHIDCANIQPRQTGKSASTDCLNSWLLYIGASNTSIILLTKDDPLRKKNVLRLKGIRDYLPSYLVTIQSDDADNQIELTCKLLGNDYQTGVGQGSEPAAEKVGRGFTAPVIHNDEGPFTDMIDIMLPAALGASTAARDEAELTGNPYGNIFTTTAGKIDSRSGAYMYNLIHSGATWDEAYLDAPDRKTLVKMVARNGSGRQALLNITLSHKQLGKSDEWLFEKIANTRGTAEQAERDFMNKWTTGGLSSPLTAALNEAIFHSEMDVVYSEISPDCYILRWYVPEEEIVERMNEGHYIIGLDTSDAIGRDTIALVITDIRDLSVVAAGTYNETNLMRFVAYLVGLLIKYHRTTLVIEKALNAQMMIDFLILKLSAVGIDPFRRIFNRIVDQSGENEEAYRQLLTRIDGRSTGWYDVRKSKFGFVSGANNRDLLYGTVLQNAAKQSAGLVRDKRLSQEIRGLIVKNDRIDHKSSGHDDMVIAWLLCHWFLNHARNLAHYGIDLNDLMSATTEQGRELNPMELREREKQAEYLTEIEEVLNALKKASGPVVIAQYEHRLKVLESRLSDTELGDRTGIDALIQKAAEERQKNQRIQAREQMRTNAHQPLTFNSPYRNFRR